MTQFTYRSIVTLTLILPLAPIACARSTDESTVSRSDVASLRAVHRVLAPGDHGADVGAVFSYLQEFGYFPNDTIAEHYPYWAPVVDALPKDPEHFGRGLTTAVQAYQRYGGLEPTGVVDKATLALMLQERCGNPENEFALRDEQDPSEKWDHLMGSQATLFPSGSAITWFTKSCTGMNNTACPAYAGGPAESGAFSLWQGETNLTFTHLTSCGSSCTPGIEIRYYDNTNVPTGWAQFGPNTLAFGSKLTTTTGQLAVNTGIDWSTQTDRLMRAVTHEIGHVLGLAHSSLGPLAKSGQPTNSIIVNSTTNAADTAVMYYITPSSTPPLCPHGNPCWNLTLDDRQSIIARCETGSVHPPTHCYSSWTQLPGFATDIAVGGTTPVGPITWVTSGSNTIWKRGLNTFVQDPNSNGIAIAVTSAGVPWVVTSNNLIQSRTNATCNLDANGQCPGTWQTTGGGTSGRDIAIGGSMDNIWAVTNIASGGDFVVRHWDGSRFQLPSNAIAAQRVTVDSKGFPWVVKADHSIWTSASTDGSVAWTQVTAGASCANDIGAGRNGGVYAIGCVAVGQDFDIWILDQQVKTQVGDPATVTTWRPLSGIARRVAVGPDARPYVVQSSGGIFNLEGI